MRCSIVVILFDFVLQTHAKELSANHGSEVQHSTYVPVDNLVDKLANRVLKVWPLHNADLDEATLGKIYPDKSPGNKYAGALLLVPRSPLSISRLTSRSGFHSSSHRAHFTLPLFPSLRSPLSVSHSPLTVARSLSNTGVSEKKEGISFADMTLDGSDVRVGIIKAAWNYDIIDGLYKGVNESLTECGVKPGNVFTTTVPGAFELPVTAKLLADSERVDAIICLGCLIKGDTMHFEYIAQAASSGIMQVSVDTMVPCLFGVLTVLNKEQAIIRSEGETNEGRAWGKSAVEMGLKRMAALGLRETEKRGKQPLWNLPPPRRSAGGYGFRPAGYDIYRNK